MSLRKYEYLNLILSFTDFFLCIYTSDGNREISQPSLQDNRLELASFQVYKLS